MNRPLRLSRIKFGVLVLASSLILGLDGAVSRADEDRTSLLLRGVIQDDTIRVPEFELPLSGFLSVETRAVLVRHKKELADWARACPYDFIDPAAATDVPALRLCEENHYYAALVERDRRRYKVDVTSKTIAGVPTDVIIPASGESIENRARVLINLHGGGFTVGGHWAGLVESIPVAAAVRIKIISVNYRMAPEYRFPAASEDVSAVFKALLAQYKPENIGIYGCGAGGRLTAQTIAWLEKEKQPFPGAIGIFCGGFLAGKGDSSQFVSALAGPAPSADGQAGAKVVRYLTAADLKENVLANPGLSPRLLAKFPPTLIISSTRDAGLSSAVASQAKLISLGVNAELHVWEGLGNAFFYEPDYPESREVYAAIGSFFRKHLGK
jgi:epsilon-lactone hydrolase